MAIERQHPVSQENDAISIRDLVIKLIAWFKYLLKRWKIIVVMGLLGACLGFAYASIKDPVYTATTTFVLESGEGSNALGQYAGLANMVGIDVGGTGGGIFQGDNILELYKSRSMIAKTLLTEVELDGKKQLLIDYYIYFNNLKETWKDRPQLLNLKFSKGEQPLKSVNSRLKDSLINSFVASINKNNLVVSKLDKNLSIIKVDVNAKDEFFAKAFNDHIVENVNDFYIQTKTKKSLDNVHILAVKVDSVRAVMNGAIYTSAAVADATPNLNPTRQIQRSAPIQRSQFTAETNKAILSELVKNLELSKMSLLKEAPLIQIIDQPNFPLQKVVLGRIFTAIIAGIVFGILTSLFLLVGLFFRNLNY
jgi:hypothetical protein